MVDLDDLARRAVTEPVGAPRPLEELDRRARERRRRRVTGGAAVALVFLAAAVGGGAVLLGEDDRDDDATITSPASPEDGDFDLGTGRVVWPGGNVAWTQEELLESVTVDLLGWPATTEWATEAAPGSDSALRAWTGHPDVDGRDVSLVVDEVAGSWRVVDGEGAIGLVERDGQAALTDLWLYAGQEEVEQGDGGSRQDAGTDRREVDATTIEVRWVDRSRGEQELTVDVDDLVDPATGNGADQGADDLDGLGGDRAEGLTIELPGTGLDDLGSVLVVARASDGQATSLWTEAFDAHPPSRTVALDGLFDRPATPDDAFPEDLLVEGRWQPDGRIADDLDFSASRAVPLAEDVPAFAVPTGDRGGVCFFVVVDPPAGDAEVVDGHGPVGCAEATTFNRRGIPVRACGPEGRWVTAALVPLGLDPEAVEPHGTLRPSGAVILYEGDGAGERVGLEYAPGRRVELDRLPFGTLPGDRASDQNEVYC
jgi:hypothetical protein